MGRSVRRAREKDSCREMREEKGMMKKEGRWNKGVEELLRMKGKKL